jgi:hypothetical protein
MQGAHLRPGYCWALLLLGGVCAVTGCSSGGGETLIPVAGKVTVGGKPLTTGSVSFRPDSALGNSSQHQPNGAIDAEGKFELYVPPSRKGAPPGWYRVVVTAYDDPQPGKPIKSFIDRKYSDEKSTPLKVEVIAQPETGRYDFKLNR